LSVICSSGATPGRTRANALAQIPPPWQSNVNNKIKYQDILTALADETNDLSMPCHEQRTGAATGHLIFQLPSYPVGIDPFIMAPKREQDWGHSLI